MAGFARHFDVGQKAHFDGANALPFAGRAATLAGVEAEAALSVAARLGFQRFSEKLAYGVPEADVGGGAAARGFADRRLVDFQHPVYGLEAAQRRAAYPQRVATAGHGVTPGLGAALADCRLHVGEEHVAGQGGFAGTGDAGDGDQALQGEFEVDVLEVVEVGGVEL